MQAQAYENAAPGRDADHFAACGKLSAGSAPIYAVTDETTYLDYAGYQFSGADPWDGTLAVTINSIIDGKMEWIFTDSFKCHTLYQVQQGTVLQDGKAAFDIQGSDVENEGGHLCLSGRSGAEGRKGDRDL